VNTRALVFLLLGACGPDAGDAPAEGSAAATVARGAVVARVGAAEVGLHDVEQVVHETGLSPQQALDRLVAEQLLGQRAEERGYGSGAVLSRELKKARARALLEQTVEREITPEGFPAAQVEARFASLKASLDRPEARAITVLLFPSTGPAPMLGAIDAKAALERLSGLPLDAQHEQLVAMRDEAAEHGLSVRLDQQLMPLHGKGVDPAVLRAVSALTEPGLVPQVVQAERGSMLVLVDEFVPAHQATLSEHEAAIRGQLASEARAARTKELVDGLAKQAQVRYDDQAIQRVLSDDSLLGNLP
jgi:hypothetical protein